MKNFAISVLYLSFAALVIAVAARLFVLPDKNETPQISEEEIRQELYDSIYEEIHDAAYAEGETRGKVFGYDVGYSDGYDAGERKASSKLDFEAIAKKNGFTYTPKTPIFVFVTSTGEKYHTEKCEHLSKSKIKVELDAAKSLGYTMCTDCFS